MQAFIDGLTYQERGLLNGASRGLLMAQGPACAKEVIIKMAKDSLHHAQKQDLVGAKPVHVECVTHG